MELGDVFPKLTVKEGEILIMVHPYLDGLSRRDAAEELGISVTAVQQRLSNVFKKIPWLKVDMAEKRVEDNRKKESLRRPRRLGDMEVLEYGDDKIVRKF